MFGKTIISTMDTISYDRRVLIVTVFLASMATLLVITSIAAFVYVTRKEKILRKSHLVSVIIILLVELTFLVAIVTCCTILSKNTQGQILAVVLIILSLLSLMALIYFLLEDILKERIEPCRGITNLSKCHTIREITSISRHVSPIPPPPPSPCADETAIPIPTPPALTPVPRLPTPPLPSESPIPDKPISPLPEETVPEPLAASSPPPYIINYEKVRQDLLAAIEERTIPTLEGAIQQVKDYDYIQQLRYECERALELLNRLVKIEHMKIKVLRLNQSTIAELHSYIKPPDEVSTVMRATFLLLGHADREIQDWPQIQNLLGRFGKDSVRRRCYELNPLSIPVDKAHEAKDILRNYDLIRVSEISVGLSAFYCWAATMIEEREKLLESQRRIVR